MKRAILTLIVASVALVGCKRDNPDEPTPAPTNEDVIQLASGMEASVQYALSTKSGVRDELGFKVSDHIGITAIYSKDPNAEGGANVDEPNLGVARWFINKPATAEAPTETTTEPKSWYNKFHWGEGETSISSDGVGVTGDYQFYPQGRYIFLYAYHPLAQGVTGDQANGVEFIPGTIAADATASFDQIKVTLQPESLNTGFDDAGTAITPVLALKQSDVMVGANAKRKVSAIASVNRKSPISDVQLSFQHVLAQLRLKIRRTPDVKELPILQKVEISWPKFATYTIKETASAPKDLPAMTDGKYADADMVKHTIVCKVEIEQGDADVAVDILGADNKQMLMLHPLTQAELEGCVINITVKFPSITTPKVFPVSLASLADGIVQGKCNVVNLLVNYVKIDLTGDITPWAEGEIGHSDID